MQSLAGSPCRLWSGAELAGGGVDAIRGLQDSFHSFRGLTPGVQRVLPAPGSPVAGSAQMA